MLAEWENIHNKVLFDAVNDCLDEFRPYGLRGPPSPWSGQTRALTYRYSQNAKEVLQHVREKVVGLSKTFGGALANSELLREYHIRGPLEQDKLVMLREERLAIMMMQDVSQFDLVSKCSSNSFVFDYRLRRLSINGRIWRGRRRASRWTLLR